MTDHLPADAYRLELEKLCPSGAHPIDRARIQRALELNQRTWRALLAADPIAAYWLLLDALVARIDATEEPDSIIYASRMHFCAEVARRLLHRHGAAACWNLGPKASGVALRLLTSDDLTAFAASRPRSATP